jgi:hypothetical protein
MISKTITNTNCPIPNEGDFRPAGPVVFTVVIRAPSPPGQALSLGTAFNDPSLFPVSLFELYRSSPTSALNPYDRVKFDLSQT